jgi:AbiV family abortive infection protein
MARKPTTTAVSTEFLARGMWCALEQSGFLLCDAVNLHNAERFPTAIALALLAAEEFGKSRILLDYWEKANQGQSITIEAVRRAVKPHKPHETKQTRALLSSLTAGLARGTEIGDLLFEFAMSAKRLLDKRAEKSQPLKGLADELSLDPLLPKLASAMTRARERTLYVDADDSATSWERPCKAFGAKLSELALLVISNIYNSYTNAAWNLQPKRLRANTSNPRPDLASALEAWAERPELPSAPTPKFS